MKIDRKIGKRIMHTILLLFAIRMISFIPVPGVKTELVRAFFAGNAGFEVVNTLLGNGLSRFSVLSLSISPYINASIIIQLICILSKKFESMQQDGEAGRKKLNHYTQIFSLLIALVSAFAISVGFQKNGFAEGGLLSRLILVFSLTAGSSMLVCFANSISENGIGNGISMILLLNIATRIPQDLFALYARFIHGSDHPLLSIGVILFVILLLILFTIYLGEAERKIPVQFTNKLLGAKSIAGEEAHIPIKLNGASVMPIVYAMTLLSFPQILLRMISPRGEGFAGELVSYLNQGSWFDLFHAKYTLGYLLFAVLVIAFSCFQMEIVFHPAEIADQLKKQGAMIVGVNPGRETEDYLRTIQKRTIFTGTAGLLFLSTAPMILSGLFHVKLSFGGSSLLIIIGVLLEIKRQIQVLRYDDMRIGFLR